MSGPAYHARTHLLGGTDPLARPAPRRGATTTPESSRCPAWSATGNSPKPPAPGPTPATRPAVRPHPLTAVSHRTADVMACRHRRPNDGTLGSRRRRRRRHRLAPPARHRDDAQLDSTTDAFTVIVWVLVRSPATAPSDGTHRQPSPPHSAAQRAAAGASMGSTNRRVRCSAAATSSPDERHRRRRHAADTSRFATDDTGASSPASRPAALELYVNGNAPTRRDRAPASLTPSETNTCYRRDRRRRRHLGLPRLIDSFVLDRR